MKHLLFICVLLLLSAGSFAQERQVSMVKQKSCGEDRSLCSVPVVIQEGNLLNITSDSYDTKMQVTVRNGGGQIVLSELLFVSPGVCHTLTLPEDLENGFYKIEIYCGEGEEYYGYFEMYRQF